MVKLKSNLKLMIAACIILISCMIIPNISSAAYISLDDLKKGPNEGKSVIVGYNTLISRNDLYCIQKHAALRAVNVPYTVQKYVKIVGNTATDTKGNTNNSKLNGRLAYIIAHGQGYGPDQYSCTPSQWAVWSTINTWFAKSGVKLGNFNYSWASNNISLVEHPDAKKLIDDGTEYAKNIGKVSNDEKVTNKTNKSKIKVKNVTMGNKEYTRMGPFKYSFSGKITSLQVKDQDGKDISNVRFGITEGKQQKFVSTKGIKSNKNFYIYIDSSANVTKVTGLTGNVSVPGTIYTAEIWFLISADQQNNILVKPGSEPKNTNLEFNDTYDIPITVNLNVKKVDEDNTTKALANVEFIFYNKELKQYVQQQNGNTTYVTSKDQATRYKTNNSGDISVTNLKAGTYLAYEVANPNPGYVISEEPTEINAKNAGTINKTIKNKFKYIKLSGYVWIDKPDEVKQSARNDLYRDNNSDTADIRKSGITVRLKDNSGKVLQETKTNENGEYLFEQVDVDTVESDYIEFLYDGLIYQNVDVHLDKDNGSKSAEGSLRDEFNNKFARIDPKARDEVQVKDGNGSSVYNVKYELDSENSTASIKESNCEIVANTRNAGYTIKYDRNSDTAEVKNINLGLYEREQADLALTQDLEQVKISVKGDTHIYKYASRFEGGTPSADDWNVGVQFPTNRNNITYLRPVYRADAEYQDTENANNNIKIYLSYKIALGNQSSILSKVNGISDYFDSRYEFTGAGLGIDEKGNITNSLKTNVDTNTMYGNQYHKVNIETSSVIKPNDNPQYVYVQFALSRENILNLLNEAKIANNNIEPNLKNIAEITSYTTYTDESMSKYYAAVDKDSVIDNIIVEDTKTYEDDTRTAPNVGLVIANAREVSGVIFEDNSDETMLREQNIRQGDGKFDSSKESTIGGVTVELMEVDDNGNVTDKVAQVYDETLNDGQGGWTEAKLQGTTSEDGKYSFRGFVPGKYAVKYTWGNGMYKVVNGNRVNYENAVENYKATNIDENRYNQEKSNLYYYNKLNGEDLSHGIDDWNIRKEIDTQMNSHSSGTNNGYNHATTVTTNTMVTYAPAMRFKIEYDDNDLNNITENATNQVTFNVGNIDLGITQRPQSSVLLEKRIAHIKMTYTSGDVLIDADIDDDGKLIGQTNYLTYVKPTISNGQRVKGFLKAEIDSEVVQDTTLEVTYKFVVKNTSEADYASEGFYNFGNGYYASRGQAGETQKERDVVTISPSKMIDYLDKEIVYNGEAENSSKYGWAFKNLDDIKNGKYVTSDVENALGNSDKTYEYYTEYLANANLKPNRMVGNSLTDAGSSADIYMVADKSLTPSQDININNQIEIVEFNKSFGSKISCTPGNYIPFGEAHEVDDSMSEELIITPSTGANKNYAIIGTVTFIALITLGAGTYFIRKFNKKQ